MVVLPLEEMFGRPGLFWIGTGKGKEQQIENVLPCGLGEGRASLTMLHLSMPE